MLITGGDQRMVWSSQATATLPTCNARGIEQLIETVGRLRISYRCRRRQAVLRAGSLVSVDSAPCCTHRFPRHGSELHLAHGGPWRRRGRRRATVGRRRLFVLV